MSSVGRFVNRPYNIPQSASQPAPFRQGGHISQKISIHRLWMDISLYSGAFKDSTIEMLLSLRPMNTLTMKENTKVSTSDTR